jgi:hypothetical protein
MPLLSTPFSTVMSGVVSGSSVESHCERVAGTFDMSRLERWSRSTLSTAGSLGTDGPSRRAAVVARL